MRHGVVTVPLLGCALLLSGASMLPHAAAAQGHVHEPAPSRAAITELLLEGPHLILHHRGLLALSDSQQVALRRAQRSLCSAEGEYVRQRDDGRARLVAAVGGAPGAGSATRHMLRPAIDSMVAAEAVWLAALVGARRDALALLSATQREQLAALRQHWARETAAMIDEATRPGQRGHPGMQLPIRVPGMVVGETTLLPYCESLHGPAVHISIPPPR